MVWRWGESEIIYLSLRYHHQNDLCIKLGSDESHFNVSYLKKIRDSHKTVSTDHNFWRERRTEAEWNWSPSAYLPNALPLGQTSSRTEVVYQPYRWAKPAHEQGFKVLLSFWPLGAKKRSYIRTRHSLWTNTCVLLINNYHTLYIKKYLKNAQTQIKVVINI